MVILVKEELSLIRKRFVDDPKGLLDPLRKLDMSTGPDLNSIMGKNFK